MRRKGRWHGTVRCYLGPAPLPGCARFNEVQVPGDWAQCRVACPIPTGHSKPTGRCGNARCKHCHRHPAWKSARKGNGVVGQWRSHYHDTVVEGTDLWLCGDLDLCADPCRADLDICADPCRADPCGEDLCGEDPADPEGQPSAAAASTDAVAEAASEPGWVLV